MIDSKIANKIVSIMIAVFVRFSSNVVKILFLLSHIYKIEKVIS